MNQPRLRPGRRSDIQALRAAAIALVVVNHLWPEHLTGGFIGVDVFFVISGYLITSHLVRELESTDRIRLMRFWSRRAVRLLPAALAVLVFCAGAALVWAPITLLEATFVQIGAAALYVLNWVLSATAVDYFAQGAGQTMVTHLWSLSVEEQFYLLWPLVLLATYVVARRARKRRSVLLVMLLAVAVISLAWAIYNTSVLPSSAYFETSGRAWEFAIGGCVALLPVIRENIRLRLVPLTWVGWAAILTAAVTLDGDSGIPGASAMLPVFGTALLIWIGEFESDWSPRPLLQFRPVQLLGELSYSVYLWHWPLIVLAPQIIGRDLFARDKVILIAITIALAFFTKRFIEDPIRFGPTLRKLAPPTVLAIAVAATLVIFCAATIVVASVGERGVTAAESLYDLSADPGPCFGAQANLSGDECQLSNDLGDREYLLSRASIPNITLSNGSYCQQLRGKSEVLTCSFGVPEGEQEVNVALIGDSHAGMWAPALDAVAPELGIRVTAYLDSACPATLDPGVIGAYSHIAIQQSACEEWRMKAISDVAADPDIDVVITSARDRNYRFADGAPDSGAGYASAWTSWLEAGKRVIVINDTPLYPFSVPECIAAARSLEDPCTAASIIGLPPGPMALAAHSISDPNLRFVDYTRVFCDDEECHSVVGGLPVYVDFEHLSESFARSFGADFLQDQLD